MLKVRMQRVEVGGMRHDEQRIKEGWMLNRGCGFGK